MLALYLMLLATYHAQNYAGIIGWSLVVICKAEPLFKPPIAVIGVSVDHRVDRLTTQLQ